MGRPFATVTTNQAAEILGMSTRTFRKLRSHNPESIFPCAITGKTGRQLLFTKRDVVALKKDIRRGIVSCGV